MYNDNNQPNDGSRHLYIEFVRATVLKFYISKYEVFKTLPEDILFFKALKVLPTTKKVICEAFDLNIESICRYKREFEKNGTLKQSRKKVICQFTGHSAHLLTTNTLLFKTEIFD